MAPYLPASRKILCLVLSVLCLSVCFESTVFAQFSIRIDYSFDDPNGDGDTSDGFFTNNVAAQNALRAAADRFERILAPTNLSAVPATGNGTTPDGWRIGFFHPGTGNSVEYSTAGDAGVDPLSGSYAANFYGFQGLAQDEWVLFAGGRPMGIPQPAVGFTAGVGGTGGAINRTDTFDDPVGPYRRDQFSLLAEANNSPAGNLPAWGGSISFNSDIDHATSITNWHFETDASNPPTLSEVDFYSIALHEIGHALGMSSYWEQLDQYHAPESGELTAPNALAAYNTDNNANRTWLDIVDGGTVNPEYPTEPNEYDISPNMHWADNTYQSEIFALGDPNYNGTVGVGALQDLLLDPSASSSVARQELTNVDVGMLQDLGWEVIPEPSTYAMLALAGIVGVIAARRKKNALAEAAA
jgi:hypothetical protein